MYIPCLLKKLKFFKENIGDFIPPFYRYKDAFFTFSVVFFWRLRESPLRRNILPFYSHFSLWRGMKEWFLQFCNRLADFIEIWAHKNKGSWTCLSKHKSINQVILLVQEVILFCGPGFGMRWFYAFQIPHLRGGVLIKDMLIFCTSTCW